MRLLKLFILFGISNILCTFSLKLNNTHKNNVGVLSNSNRNKFNLVKNFLKDDEFSTKLFKQQVVNELKNSEDALKDIFFKMVNHLFEYVKHRLMFSFYNYCVINPINLPFGNLLNTKVNNYYLTSKLNLDKYSTPMTFGLNYQHVNLNKKYGYKLNNSCWFIKSNNPNADRAFILMHGWFGNLQSSLPFLNVLNQTGVLNKYHVLVLNLYDDLNNSFESNIGLKGVTNLYDGINYLYKKYKVKTFSVYAQSVSSLSVLMLYDYILSLKNTKQYNNVYQPNEGEYLEEEEEDVEGFEGEEMEGESCYFKKNCDKNMLKEVEFENIVLESPVMNIKQYTTDFKFYEQLLSMTNNRFDGHLRKLNLSDYLKKKEIRKKVSILQGMKDDVTTLMMLKEELGKLDELPKLFLFKQSGHIDLSVHNSNEYYKTVNYLLNYSPLFRFFCFNRNRVKSLKHL